MVFLSDATRYTVRATRLGASRPDALHNPKSRHKRDEVTSAMTDEGKRNPGDWQDADVHPAIDRDMGQDNRKEPKRKKLGEVIVRP